MYATVAAIMSGKIYGRLEADLLLPRFWRIFLSFSLSLITSPSDPKIISHISSVFWGDQTELVLIMRESLTSVYLESSRFKLEFLPIREEFET